MPERHQQLRQQRHQQGITTASDLTGRPCYPGSVPSDSLRKVAVVFNPTKVPEARLRPAVHKALGDEVNVTWLATTEADNGGGQAQQAIDEEVDGIIVVGGDGTVRAVASAMLESSIPLTIVPQGTGNVLARNLALPLANAERAIKLATTGIKRDIDLGIIEIERPDGTVDTDVFLVMCGIGLDAEIMATTSSFVKRFLGWLAYVGAALHLVSRNSRFLARIKVRDQPSLMVRSHTILVGNCGTMPGNIILLPEATIDDGNLDLVAMSPRGPLGWLGIGQRVLVEHPLEQSTAGRKLVKFTNGARQLRQLTYLRGPAIDIQTREPQQAEIDGDVAGEAVRMKLRIAHKQLTVMVPHA